MAGPERTLDPSDVQGERIRGETWIAAGDRCVDGDEPLAAVETVRGEVALLNESLDTALKHDGRHGVQVTLTAKFTPGHLGLFIDGDSGLVSAVEEESQAWKQGVKVGMEPRTIDNAPFDQARLNAKINQRGQAMSQQKSSDNAAFDNAVLDAKTLCRGRFLDDDCGTYTVTFVHVEKVNDLQLVSREYRDGQGKFEVLHNSQLSRSLMSGSFENVSSTSQSGLTTYQGTFLNDPHQEAPLPHGQGTRQNPDGSTYAGQWKDGFPDGRGEWKAPGDNGESYVGEWKKGKKHGFGLMNFANGDSYEGDWADGKFQDRGKYEYANGDVFMGIYDKGVKVSGSFYFKDGRVSTRKWEGGKLISCQDFDSRRRVYNPTISHQEVHSPERNSYGAKASFGMVSPRGVKIG